jgi:signal transduction histidine kinase
LAVVAPVGSADPDGVMSNHPIEPAGSFLGRCRSLVRLLWRQALWAIPFALFFGTIYGADLGSYLQALQVSLVFSYSIGFCVWLAGAFVMPRLGQARHHGGKVPLWLEASVFGASSIIGSYLGAAIVHFTIVPDFIGTPRALLISGMFALIFTFLFGGIIYANVFYRQAVARARAVEQARAELAQAELRALRAQINPHFLFNTLNTIASLVRRDPAAAEDTVTRLADLFRYTLTGSERGLVPFREELEFLRNYLTIERVRFGDRLRIVEQIAPGLDSVAVPSLLLQPLVENAVRYAVGSRPEGAQVRIAARRESGHVVLEVEDDGPGIDGATGRGGAGFGLHSVRERLRAAGPPHALEIRSRPGHGTHMIITLPDRPYDASAPDAFLRS